MYHLIKVIFLACLAVAITSAAEVQYDEEDDDNSTAMPPCKSACYCNIRYEECFQNCGAKRIEKRDIEMFFKIPTMPSFPMFESVTPFPQKTLGEALYNRTKEKTTGNAFNRNKAFEQFVPNANSEVYHPDCIEKIHKQCPKLDKLNCKPEACDLPEHLKTEVLKCSKDYVSLKGYMRNYDHTDDKTLNEEFNQNAGFKKMMTKAGEQTKVFNSTTGGNVSKKSEATLQYEKDVLFNEAGNPVEISKPSTAENQGGNQEEIQQKPDS
ncbi:hypothetical protein O3M35_009479 [Rhynocoris fuscipes]|uniref:Uncharacterized protein n=1 Tax=Rhynocoris fuscipes TaxID=488301 RepID=A0AAW1D5C7_9HEMI